MHEKLEDFSGNVNLSDETSQLLTMLEYPGETPNDRKVYLDQHAVANGSKMKVFKDRRVLPQPTDVGGVAPEQARSDENQNRGSGGYSQIRKPNQGRTQGYQNRNSNHRSGDSRGHGSSNSYQSSQVQAKPPIPEKPKQTMIQKDQQPQGVLCWENGSWTAKFEGDDRPVRVIVPKKLLPSLNQEVSRKAGFYVTEASKKGITVRVEKLL